MQAKKRAIVVDGNNAQRENFARALKKLEFEVTDFKDKASAINHLNTLKAKNLESPHICIVHLWRAQAESIEFIRELYERDNSISTFYTSIYREDELFLDARMAGAFGVLDKEPFRYMDKFKDQIQKAYDASVIRKGAGFVFVAMPFDEIFDARYRHIKSYLECQGIECHRADDKQMGNVMEIVKRYIEASQWVLGDLTGNKPNVFYEIGYADGQGKAVILLVEKKDQEKVPFDLSGQYHIGYDDPAQLDEALKKVVSCIKDSSAMEALKSTESPRGDEDH